MAVYTHVSAEEAKIFISQYDRGNFIELLGISSGVSNTNYIVRTERGNHILTLYESATPYEDLPFFMDLMTHLADEGVACPRPYCDRQGKNIHTLAGKPAALTQFLEGKSITRIEVDDCAAIGQALAQMHRASQSFQGTRRNSRGLPAWKEFLFQCKDKADQVQEGLYSFLQEEMAFLEKNWPHHLPSGIIHADVFPDNVFFDRGRVSGIIDFYFACSDLYAYEIAIVMNAWCFEANKVSFNLTKARALLHGYTSLRKLSAEERQLLPIVARGASVRFLMSRLYDWLHQVDGALVRPKDPMEYVKKLQFHQRVCHVQEYGLE